MAPVISTPVEGFTGTIAGVHFADGVGETDDPAALLYFSGAGYGVRDVVPPAGTPLTEEELARVAASEAVADSNTSPPQRDDTQSGDGPSEEVESGEDDPESGQEQPERPHPVQGSKAVWFEHLSTLNPDHGFDLAKVSRKELIEAVEAIESAKG